MVGVLLLSDSVSVERLVARDRPVVVDLVGNLVGDVVGGVGVDGGLSGGLVGQLVLDTHADSHGVALDAAEALPAVDGLERVVDALLDLLVAAGADHVAGHVGTEPVLRLLALSGSVDKLGPDLEEGLGVPLGGDTEVELVSDLEVDLGLDDHLLLLVVLGGDLHSKGMSWVST